MPLLSIGRRVGDARRPSTAFSDLEWKAVPTASRADRIASSWAGDTSRPSSNAATTQGVTAAASASSLGVHFSMSRACRHWSGLTRPLAGSGEAATIVHPAIAATARRRAHELHAAMRTKCRRLELRRATASLRIPAHMNLTRGSALLVISDAATQVADPGHQAHLRTGVLSAPGLGNM